MITITGMGFLSATSVTFGGVEAQMFTVVSDTEIEAVNPPFDSASVPVVVSGPTAAPVLLLTAPNEPVVSLASGAGTFALAGFAFAVPAAPMFTYEDPVISGISPDSGPTAGGTAVSITGVGFDSTTLVTVDGIAVDFTLISDTVITFTFTFTSPEHAAGTVSVVVDGESEPDLGEFTYTDGLAGTGFAGLIAAGFGVLVLLLGVLVMTLRRRKLHLLS